MDELISRQAAIDEIDEWIKAFRENGHKESAADACLIQDGILNLPSVQTDLSEYSEKLWKAAYERGKKEAQPERKKGEWIEVEVFPESYDIYGNKTWSSEMQCDQCGFRHTAIEGHMAQYNYCPNCGADMRGEEDDS